MSETQFWIGTSWKMNKTTAEAQAFSTALGSADANHDHRIQRFVIPPHVYLTHVAQILSGTSVKVGTQNMHWADDGAWTGEISPTMIKDCGANIVELGHSERRAFFNETDETVGLKVAAALRHNLIPLICIGETLEQRVSGRASAVLEQQVRGALGFASEQDLTKPILFAYEPVWAIGDNGIPATSQYADDMHEHIKSVTKDVLGRRLTCLYGGSVNSENCVELFGSNHIDGLFIGRAAWDVQGYLHILEMCHDSLT